jgi:UDP-N-acetylmuramoyl-tripeptide--D-alanyl-D-alanine ligase
MWSAITSRLPRYLILEFGTDGPGDVEAIVKQIQPDVAVLTIVGPAHLANYPSEEAMAHDEGWLVEATRPSGHVFLNSADPYLEEHKARTQAKVVVVTTPLELMAIRYTEAVGQQLGFEKKTVDLALANYQPPEHRLEEKVVGSFRLLDDSYNASPLAMQAALRRLQKLPGRHVAVLGAMLELGPKEINFHQEVGRFARDHADLIIGVGELAKAYKADHWFATSAEAAEQLFALLKEGDTILVKGSKATKMEKIITALANHGSA